MLSKRSSAFFITILTVIGLLAFVGIAAQEGDDAIQEETTTTSATDGSDASAADRGTAEDRIEEIKARREARIDSVRENIITRKCNAAQTRISNHAANVLTGQNRRSSAYENTANKLTNIINRFEGQDVDTTEVVVLVTTFNNMWSAFIEGVGGYRVVLNDLANMDCTADAEGFQATLEEARSLGVALKTDTTDIHSFLKVEVKTALQNLIGQLRTDNPDAEEEA